MEELRAEIEKLRVQVQRMADALQKKEDRTQYQAEYYKKRKAAAKALKKEVKRLSSERCVFKGLRRRDVPHKLWAQKMQEFLQDGRSIYNWLTWVAWSWNQNTWEFPPITRSGGYYNVFIGMSGAKALRSRYTERDITGHVRVRTFTTKLQLETFSSALFWAYCFRTVGLVASEHEEDSEWYQQMPTRWRNVIEVLKGALGQFKIPNSEIYFNPEEKDLQVMSKAYGHVRLMLEQVWACTLKGWFSKKEPFTAPSE